MKHILKAFYITVAIATVFVAHNTPQTIDLVTDTKAGCPAGTYQIGDRELDGYPICKNEPTGCAYGDSIPLDSPKCAPSPVELEQQKQDRVQDSALTPDYSFRGK